MSGTDSFVSSIQALAESLRMASNDPLDAINGLASLASFVDFAIPGTSSIARSVVAVTDAVASACRRAALTSLARACASYTPATVQDAQAVIDLIGPLYDLEIDYAADMGDQGTFAALRALRSSVVIDLTTRATGLPALMTITRKDSLPACVIAQQLYQDAARALEIVQRNPVPHPLFMPLSLSVLSR